MIWVKDSKPGRSGANGGSDSPGEIKHDKSTNINAQEEMGCTALHFAAFEGHTDLVRLLLQHDANVSVRDNNGRTALHFTAAKGYVKIAELLLKHDADAYIADDSGNTASDYAEFHEHYELLRLLRSHNSLWSRVLSLFF